MRMSIRQRCLALYVIILTRPNGATKEPLAPTLLRVMHASQPRGITSQSPCFSWSLQHQGRDQYPSSYEVCVKQRLANGTSSQAWMTNVSVAPNTLGQPIMYNMDNIGVPLISDTDYAWRVRWKDANSIVSAWSAWSNFTTAIIKDEDWYDARWIGMDGPDDIIPYIDVDEANRFRTEFDIHGPESEAGVPVRCSLIISGLGYYYATIQGRKIDDHELGESMQFQRRIPYENLDCTSTVLAAVSDISLQHMNLSTISLVLGIELGRGWYGEQTISALGNRPSGPRMLRCLLSLTYLDGSIERISSNPTSYKWYRGLGPVIWDQLHLGIVFDSERDSPGWDCFGLNSSTGTTSEWQLVQNPLNLSDNSSHVGYGRLASAELVTTLQPKIRKTKHFHPIRITTVVNEMPTYLVDLGQNIAGWCRYKFHPMLNTSHKNITFTHAEYLSTNGTITHAVQPLTVGAYEQSVFILPINNMTTVIEYEPRFVSYGFRYVEVSGPLATAPVPDDISCWWVHTDLAQKGTFEFASPAREAKLENRLLVNYNSTLDSAKSNYISFPTDCPHRERRGWLGDAGTASHTMAYAFDMSAAYTKWLQDVSDTAQIQYSNGNIGTISPQYNSQCVGPARLPSDHDKTAPAWSAAFVLIWDLTWRLTNDTALAAIHYSRAKAYVDFLAASWDSKRYVLPVDWGGKLLGDWCAALGVNGTSNGDGSVNQYGSTHASGIWNTFYFIKTHEALLEAQKALGVPNASMNVIKERINAARNGFNAVYYAVSEKIYKDAEVAAKTSMYGPEPLQTALSLALELGVTDIINATSDVQMALLRNVVANEYRMTSGLVGIKYLFSNLASIFGSSYEDGVDAALNILQGKESPSFGFMFSEGPGNTLWESPNGNSSWHRPRGSLNHIMLGGHAGPFFFAKLGGISQLHNYEAAGWNNFRIAPAITQRFTGFGVRIQTARGLIESSWRWMGASRSTGYILNATIPVGSEAVITLPTCNTVLESGIAVWKLGTFVSHAVIGVVGGEQDEDSHGVRITAKSGEYSFLAIVT